MPDRDRFGGSERDYRPATDGFSRVLGSDFGFPTETAGPTRPPGQPISGRHIGYGGGPIRPGQPIRTGFGGEGSRIMGYEDPTGPTRPPGQPISGRHIGYGGMGRQPIYTGFGGEGSRIMGYEDPAMDSGAYLSSRYGGGLDDAFAANAGARGMIEDAGFEVAGLTTDDRTERKLWGLAVNSFPPGTPDMQIQQKWNELKEEYYRRKYGGGSDPGDLGLTLPGRDDIVGLG